jgi:hypothetical protein
VADSYGILLAGNKEVNGSWVDSQTDLPQGHILFGRNIFQGYYGSKVIHLSYLILVTL